MKFIKAISLLICIFSSQVHAATISFDSASLAVSSGDTFSLDILGAGFLSNPDGGGVNISFDNTVLNVLSVSIDELVWDFGSTGISTGTIDNSAGTVDGIMVNAVADVGLDFIVATIEFQAIGLGSSDLLLSEFSMNPWASGGSLVNPTHQSSLVTVAETAIPVPSAVWLFGSGLIGLIGLVRRK